RAGAARAWGRARGAVPPPERAAGAGPADAATPHDPGLAAGTRDDPTPPQPLDPTVVAGLQSMTAGVVTNGTATGAGLPPDTHGKTGTAEFGTDDQLQTHAWFIGYRGDLAFAIIVTGGGVGGTVAAPIAAKFLSATGPGG